MAGLGDIVQKAIYLGVGLASYAAEKAEVNLQEIRERSQKIADELVERGEMTAKEARQYMDEVIQQAQQINTSPDEPAAKEPRVIEIVTEAEEEPPQKESEDAEALRKQLESLQEELRNLKRQ